MWNWMTISLFFFFFSSRRRHTRFDCDWSSDVCSSDLEPARTQRELGAIDGFRVLATGEELPSLRDLHQLHPVVLGDVRVPYLGEPGVDRRFAGLRLEGVQLAHRERAGRREQRRLKQLREGTHAGSRWG